MFFPICDAIQQKVHKVGKLVFPMQLKLEEEIIRNIKKKKISQLMHVKLSYDVLNLWLWNS